MKILLLLSIQALFFLVAGAQDLIAGISGNDKAYVTFQVPKGSSLATTLVEKGLSKELAAKARKVGENYQLPLQEVIASGGVDKIWYRTEKTENIGTLSKIFEIDPNELMQLNKLTSSSVPKGKYLHLGYLKQASEDAAQKNNATKEKSTNADTISVVAVTPKPDSIGGLPVPVGAGYFEIEFVGKNKYLKEGKMGLFKTLGGWYDRKYYALSNDLPVGAVVRITNVSNEKYVYAKIISKMPGLKEDKKLLIRLNDAGRAALDIWGDDEDIRVQVAD